MDSSGSGGPSALTADLLLQNIEFRPDSSAFHKQCEFFEQALREFEENESKTGKNMLKAFLQFAVSLDRLGSSQRFAGGQKLIVRWVPGMEEGSLPTAHTCAWTLDLPVYGSLETLKAKLAQAVGLGAAPFAIS